MRCAKRFFSAPVEDARKHAGSVDPEEVRAAELAHDEAGECAIAEGTPVQEAFSLATPFGRRSWPTATGKGNRGPLGGTAPSETPEHGPCRYREEALTPPTPMPSPGQERQRGTAAATLGQPSVGQQPAWCEGSPRRHAPRAALLQVGVLLQVLARETQLGIPHQQAPDQFPGLALDLHGVGEIRLSGQPEVNEEGLAIDADKRRPPDKQLVEQDPDRPEVGLHVAKVPIHHFRRSVGNRDHRAFTAKVRQLQHRVFGAAAFADEDVSRPQVAMEDVLAVEGVQACDNLHQGVSCDVLRHAPTPRKEAGEIPFFAVLHEEVDARGGFLYVEEAHHVRMLNPPQSPNLSPQSVHLCADLTADLPGSGDFILFGTSLPQGAVGAPSEALLYDEPADLLLRHPPRSNRPNLAARAGI
mmetsp:Transcript_32498/g.69203  ORF Transcript_32498/g.69203 Transcript_32498/m.69203 type:complete len:414 (+) Transcript_32498:38-1279(+)